MYVTKRLVLLAMAGLSALPIGCDPQQPQQNLCPTVLPAAPSLSDSTIQWWNGPAKHVYASARITSVSAECIPDGHHTTASDKAARDTFQDYELAITATVTYDISDEASFSIAPANDSLIFEAMSRSGVVLGSATTPFSLVGGDSTGGTASAKITGLSSEEVRRLLAVRARWKF